MKIAKFDRHTRVWHVATGAGPWGSRTAWLPLCDRSTTVFSDPDDVITLDAAVLADAIPKSERACARCIGRLGAERNDLAAAIGRLSELGGGQR